VVRLGTSVAFERGPDATKGGQRRAPDPGPLERSMSLRVRRSMDTQTKREIWLLALGTAIVEAPFVTIAVAILSR
jgi:hypothetical protein